jgi:hypothetical protein
MKHLKGKTVFLEPTGNNARQYLRQKNEELPVFEAEVLKVARINLTFKRKGTYKESAIPAIKYMKA